MEFTYDNVVKWLDDYFGAFNKNAGPLETVPNMEQFFTPDLEFWSYNMANEDRPGTRDRLLTSMMHPGLHEEFTPQYYVIEEKKMIAVVQLQLQFTEEPTQTVYPPKQASAHYHFIYDENQELKPEITLLKNGREIKFLDGMDTVLDSGDVISVFPIVAGG